MHISMKDVLWNNVISGWHLVESYVLLRVCGYTI